MVEQVKTWAHPKTLAEWRKKIVASLGGEGWNAELTEQILDHALWETLALYNKFRPRWKWRPLGEIVGDVTFDLNDEEVGVHVVDVKFKREELHAVHQTYSRYPYPYGFMNMRSARTTHQILVAEDRYRSFLGIQPEWKWDEERRVLALKSIGAMASVLASALLLLPNLIESIRFDQEYDFLQGAVGHTKLVLARILGEYGSIPTAQGGVTLDADKLASDGKEAVERLRALLDKNVKRMPPKPIFS